MVEGKPFHAHRIALLASSEAFRAMFNQGFREKDATSITIPNLSWAVFEVSWSPQLLQIFLAHSVGFFESILLFLYKQVLDSVRRAGLHTAAYSAVIW
jgi:hypothetical protein